jgi:hypothetical protein
MLNFGWEADVEYIKLVWSRETEGWSDDKIEALLTHPDLSDKLSEAIELAMSEFILDFEAIQDEEVEEDGS